MADNNPVVLPVSSFANCTNYNQGGVQFTATRCYGTGVIIKVGFYIDPLIELYHVCYDTQRTSPIYSIHYIHGESRAMTGRRPTNWKKGGISPATLELDEVYSLRNQTRRLTEIFGTDHLYREPLERGHLAAYADFSMQSWRHASNFYINAFPQWKSINNGNWGMVEAKVREHAINAGETFKVITGTYGTLELGGGGGRRIDLYAGGRSGQDRVPVPKFSWKILYDELNRQAIGFVTLNDPYISVPRQEVAFPCNDICEAYGWNAMSFEYSPTAGYTICCEVESMNIRVIMEEIRPEIDSSRGVLRKINRPIQT